MTQVRRILHFLDIVWRPWRDGSLDRISIRSAWLLAKALYP